MIRMIRQLIGILDPRDRRRLVTLVVLMVLAAGAEVVGVGVILPFVRLLGEPEVARETPWVSDFMDRVGVRGEGQLVAWASLGLGLLFVAKNAFLAFVSFMQLRFVFDGQVHVGVRLYENYLHRPYQYHLGENSAELLRNVTQEVRGTFTHVLLPLLVSLVEGLTIAVICVLLIAVEPVVALIVMAAFGLFGGTFFLAIRRQTSSAGRVQQRHLGLMMKWANQGFGAIKEVKTLGQEDYFTTRFDESAKEYARAMRYHLFVKSLPRNVIETLGLGSIVFVVLILLARGDEIARFLPTIALFAMAGVRIMPSVTRILASVTSIRHFMPSVRVVLTGCQESEPCDLSAIADRTAHNGRNQTFEKSLRLEDLTFSYRGAHTPALEDVFCEVTRGEVVAFVGSSGAGKTTIVDVILGLLVPQSGAVLVDGRDIREDLSGWRQQIGYIAQPVYLLDDTIRRNVAFGVPDEEISDERVWSVLTTAQLARHVERLPEGIDTLIGEGGARLSGGQRQRLGIARALYRDPPILVLDEATSALDSETEREVTRALEAIGKERTILIIAHRLSTIENADRLYVMSDGRIVGTGNFAELIDRSPHFRLLTGGFESSGRASENSE